MTASCLIKHLIGTFSFVCMARLNGYLDSHAYRSLETKLDHDGIPWWMLWNIGVGPTCSFTRTISRITAEVKIKKRGPYDHVIEVVMKPAAAELPGTGLGVSDMLTKNTGGKRQRIMRCGTTPMAIEIRCRSRAC